MKQRIPRVAVAVAAWMVACAAVPAATLADQTVVRLWNWHIHDKKYTQKMVKLFNQRNPDIKWEYTSMDGSVYPQVLEAAFAAKDPPDIFYPSGALTYQALLAKGLIVAVNDIASNVKEFSDWLSKFPAEVKLYAEQEMGGKVYAFNLVGEVGTVNPLFWNKTLFKEAGLSGPPRTQSELRQAAAKLTQAGQGKSFGIIHSLKTGAEMWHYDLTGSIVRFAGGRGVDGQTFGGPDMKDGKYHIAGPEFTTALKLWVDMRKDGSVFPGETLMSDEQAKMQFATNKAGLQFGGWWQPSNYLAYNPDADFDVEFPPSPDDGIRRGYHYVAPPGAVGTAAGYVVSSFSKNPKSVWELVKFICSTEYQLGYVQGGYGASYLAEVNKPENYTVQQAGKIFGWAKDPSLRRVAPWLSQDAQKAFEFVPPVYPPLNEVLTNVYFEKSGFDALKDLQDKWDAAFDEGIKKAQEAGYKITRADFIFPDWDPTKDYLPRKR